MKRILSILTLTILISSAAYAQPDPGGKMRERMQEYLQKKLSLSRDEAERFGPIFLNYFNDLRQTNQQFRGDRIVLQQKIADLRVRYREQFKPVMGEKRSNDFFIYEHKFIEELREIRKERIENRGGNPEKRIREVPLQ